MGNPIKGEECDSPRGRTSPYVFRFLYVQGVSQLLSFLPFLRHMLTQHAFLSRGDRALSWIWFFEKKNFNFYLLRVRTRYKPSLFFRLSLVCSKIKFKFFMGIQLFGLKTMVKHGKSDPIKVFFRSGLPCGVVFRTKSRIPMENLNLLANQAEPENQAGPVPVSNPTQCPITTWKDRLLRQHKPKTGVCQKDSNCETPCS